MKIIFELEAMLFLKAIDSPAAGVIMSDVWLKTKIITMVQLATEFLEAVKTGDLVELTEDDYV